MVSMSEIKGEDARADVRKILRNDLNDLTDRRKKAKDKLKSLKKHSSEWITLRMRITDLGKRIARNKKILATYAKPIKKESIYAKR